MSYIRTLSEGIVLPAVLLFSAIFFLIYMKGAPFRTLLTDLRDLRNKREEGQSPLKAVTLALAGTLGVGNLVGVAAALLEGGAGVLFWMWLSCPAAMVVKYAEIKLCMQHRVKTPRGWLGGAMYYMPPWAGRLFAALCLACAFSVGCAMQSGAFANALIATTHPPLPRLCALLCGALLCLPLAVALFCSRRISDLTVWLVPAMSLLYFFLCLAVLIAYRQNLCCALTEIIRGAFYPKSALLGTGTGIFTALRLGVVRGILSNEAGCGTAPMAHGGSSAKSSSGQGALGVVEVAFDTLFLCTLTGLCLLVCPKELLFGASGAIAALLAVFTSIFGASAKLLLAVAIYFFAIATLLCWSFYGKSCLSFLFRGKKTDKIFYVVFCIATFLSPLLNEEAVLAFADPVIAAMTLLNLFFIFRRRRELGTLPLPLAK